MIEITNIQFRYQKAEEPILTDFSFSANKGEIIGIIGPTGSGKSTICYLFNGLIPHYFKGDFEGSINVFGRNVLNETIESMSEIVGYMLQEPSLQIASPYVEAEITFGMENFSVSIEEMDKRLDTILERLGISHLRHRATSDLSEGEKQKVILASILVMNPSLLVLDESSSMIDTTSKKELAKILQGYYEDGKTIILIDHDLDFITQVTERVLIINNGTIVADGKTSEIMTDHHLLTENGLVPPTLTSLFSNFQKNNLPVKRIPDSYHEAFEIVKEWLK